MSFLLGAYGKLAAGRRMRDIQAKLMRVQSRLRRATRQSADMSKQIEAQKKMELNGLTLMQQYNNLAAPHLAASQIPGMDPNLLAMFSGGAGVSGFGGNMTEVQQQQFAEFNYQVNQLKMKNEAMIAQEKSRIEQYYENMTESMLEPLKQEEDMLQTEKDSLESQLQIAQADYKACQDMEKADAKNLAPNYTGQ